MCVRSLARMRDSRSCFLVVVVTLGFALTQGYTLQKCCPLHQHLDTDFETCVDVVETNSSSPSSFSLFTNTSDSVQSELISSSGLPWWFPQDAWILSADSWERLSPNTSFLNGEFPLQVSHGVSLPCSFQTTQLLPGETFLEDGSLLVEEEGNMTYPSLSYCVDRVNIGSSAEAHIVKLCPCLTRVCLRKCCAEGKLLRTEEGHSRCAPAGNSSHDWKPPFLDPTMNHTFKNLIGKQRCDPGKIPLLLNPTPDHQHRFWLLANGSVQLEKQEVRSALHYKAYCAEVTEYEDGSRAPNLVFCGAVAAPPADQRHRGTLFGVLFAVGAAFLLATLAVYAVTPELRSLHGNNLMAHSASFLVAYVAMAAGQLAPHMPYRICVAVGFITQFSFLAAFFWLNVMCIDISWTFSGLRPPPGSAKVRDKKKFMYYSVYAWGTTSFISLVTAVMEFMPSTTILKPNFGIRTCLFKEAAATLVYFYMPMALLLFTNLVLFLFTAYRIIKVKRQTVILHKPGSSAYNKEKQRLILYVKLFLLMGITWVTEIISWAVGGPYYYWYLTDILNLLRAVFIFIIFCCKRQVYHLLRTRATTTFKMNTSRANYLPKPDIPQTTNSSAKKDLAKSGTSSSSLASQTHETVMNA